MPEGVINNMVQICVVVRNRDEAMRHYGSVFGIKDYTTYEVDSDDVPGITDRGKPARNYGVRVAMARLAGAVLELIQPVHGHSMYQEFLDQHGEGIHHVGLMVDDYKKALANFQRNGFEPTVDGPIVGAQRSGRFTYLDTQEKLGATFELLDFPEEMLASWR